jgi:hypothetical protein
MSTHLPAKLNFERHEGDAADLELYVSEEFPLEEVAVLFQVRNSMDDLLVGKYLDHGISINSNKITVIFDPDDFRGYPGKHAWELKISAGQRPQSLVGGVIFITKQIAKCPG